ncbi:glycoside hydrolase [bacterium]|nr:glycoside hydrolase [bacterium]
MPEPTRHILDGPWDLAPVAQFPDEPPADMLTMNVPSHWQQHDALAGYAGRIVYRRRFDFVRAPGARARFVVPGVFYEFAAVLNGRTLGTHEGYFDPAAWDVTEILAAENELVLRVRCEKESDLLNKRAILGVFGHWDAMDPTLSPGGVWLAPYVATSGAAHVVRDQWHAERAGDVEAVMLRRLTIHAAAPMTARVHTRLAPVAGGDPIERRDTVSLAAGENTFTDRVVIPEPRLWWTHDLGAPDLYRLSVRVEDEVGETSDVFEDEIGIRMVTFEDGELRVNGERVFVKGSNYAPSDAHLATVSPDTIATDMRLAREAHMNMLRVHAHVDHPALYRAADRAGIALWQDMPLQWCYARDVLPEAVRQARAMARLLDNHPSIVCWCAHNEPFAVADTKDHGAAAIARVVASAAVFSWNRDVMDPRIAAALREEDPSRGAMISSGEPGLFRRRRDIHWYGGWYTPMGTRRSFDALLRRAPKAARCVSEFGAQSFPNLESAARFMAGDIARLDWKALEDKHGLQRELMERWTPRAPGQDLAAYIQATQDYQSEIHRHYIDRMRARKYDPCGACLQFMFNDPNPAVLWSVVDYWRVPKSSYASLAAAYRPLYAFALLPRDIYKRGQPLATNVFAVNDERTGRETRVEVVVTDDEGRELFRREKQVVLPPDSPAVPVMHVPARAHVGGVVRLVVRFTDGEETIGNVYEARVE